MNVNFFIAFPFLLFSSCTFDRREMQDPSVENNIRKLKSENEYLNTLFFMNTYKSNKLILPFHDAYGISDTERIKPITIFDGLENNTLVIRYSQIGCNSCNDLFFSYLKELRPSFRSLNKILILADYSDYHAFLKWYKISEIKDQVLIVKKGALSLDEEQNNSSYCFIINHDNVISSIFIPNSMHPEYIEAYLTQL